MIITLILIVEVPPGLMVFSSVGTSFPCKYPGAVHGHPLICRYIFMNMFTGVVVESFAYVYQRPGGVSVNREELSELASPSDDQKLRISGAFKKVWSSIDTERTGYIKRKDYIRFFSVHLSNRLQTASANA
jgi:hypothetical protein